MDKKTKKNKSMNEQDILKKHLSELGRKGALKRWSKTTREERVKYAKEMVKARKQKTVDKSIDIT